MRIAFATNPTLGHLLPLIPLAQAACDAGHNVRVVGGASLARPLADARLTHVIAGPPDLPSVFAPADVLPALAELVASTTRSSIRTSVPIAHEIC
jgi:UDP:flavonoid glycosyltransferase YjiC (YdhE family)